MNFRAQYLHELERLGLAEATCPYAGMATDSDAAAAHFLSHLQQLDVGATWRDVFPDMPAHWDLDDRKTWTDPASERPLGSFDYPDPPRGTAILAGLDGRGDVTAASTALERAHSLGIPIYGAGMVLDRGAPHMYVILPLGAPIDHVDIIADFLRDQPGLGNAYATRYEPGTEPPDDEDEDESL